ncbi:MAG: DUF1152 domain-containing protein [Ignisphaera sp.]
MELFFGGKKCLLFFAAGGGGDVATASMLALAARRLGLRSFVASVVWERFVVDPIPGPIKFDEVSRGRPIGNFSMFVDGNSKAFRGGREVVFQAARVSKVLGEPIAVIDLISGVHGVRKGLEEVLNYFGCETVVAVDVGGDIVATGFEEDLWSPLADFTGLAAVAQLKGVVAVHSPGGDGELAQDYVLKRISLITEHGGYLGARGVTREDVESLEKILEFVESEASRATLLAAKGVWGYASIRKGSREVFISPVNLLTFFLDSTIVASLNPVVKDIENCKSIECARKRLNELGIFTELDLEEEVYRLIQRGVEITGDVLLDIKKRFRRSISKG